MNGEITQHYSQIASLMSYFNEIRKYPLLSRDEEYGLARRIKQGDVDAVEKLIQGNLQFVVSIAKKYAHRGVALEELIFEGNAILPGYAWKFDEQRGVKFISYIVKPLRQCMDETIARHRDAVAINTYQREKNTHINRVLLTFVQNHPGSTPSINELVELSGETKETVVAFYNTHHRPDSLNVIFHDDQTSGELVSSNPLPSELLLERELKANVQKLLAYLSPREQNIITRYFGLGSAESETLEEIASKENISRQAVHKTAKRAYRKLLPLAKMLEYDSYLS